MGFGHKVIQVRKMQPEVAGMVELTKSVPTSFES
jgi:hypothetical protein